MVDFTEFGSMSSPEGVLRLIYNMIGDLKIPDLEVNETKALYGHKDFKINNSF